jgi:DNA-binding IscR family transcriptional regulator
MLDDRLYWAISVLELLSLPNDRGPLAAQAMGRALDAPEDALRPVLTALTRAGLLTAEGERHGGLYRLSRGVPGGVTVADVYRAVVTAAATEPDPREPHRDPAESLLIKGLAKLPLTDLVEKAAVPPTGNPGGGLNGMGSRPLH